MNCDASNIDRTMAAAESRRCEDIRFLDRGGRAGQAAEGAARNGGGPAEQPRRLADGAGRAARPSAGQIRCEHAPAPSGRAGEPTPRRRGNGAIIEIKEYHHGSTQHDFCSDGSALAGIRSEAGSVRVAVPVRALHRVRRQAAASGFADRHLSPWSCIAACPSRSSPTARTRQPPPARCAICWRATAEHPASRRVLLFQGGKVAIADRPVRNGQRSISAFEYIENL